jgi:hypothetical protein
MPPIEREVEEECGLLTSTCLKPKHSLRRQLFTAFGIASVTAIVVVTLIATLTASSAGQNVKAQARSSLEEQAKTNLGSSSRYVADAISKKFENLDGMVSLIEQATLDRFAGYPDHPGYAADENVPFRDLISGQGRYPLTFGGETSTSASTAVRCFSSSNVCTISFEDGRTEANHARGSVRSSISLTTPFALMMTSQLHRHQ